MKILVIGPAWVGDMVMSQTLYRCLKQQYPQVLIEVMALEWCRPLLLKMPEVHRAIPMPISHGQLKLGLRRSIGRQLRAESYQQAIVIPNSLKSALIPWFAQIPQRTGWRGEWRYGLLNDLRRLEPQLYPMLIQRYAALAYPPDPTGLVLLPDPLPWPQLTVTAEAVEQTMTQFELPREQTLIALAPGTAIGSLKCWPPRHYASLAERLIAQGYWVALFGAAHDQPVCKAIRDQLPETLQPRCLNYAGTTTLTEVIDLLACCRAIVSNDSGLMHIGSALGKAVVALYGPTDPCFAPPLTHQGQTLRAPPDEQAVVTEARDQGYHPRLIRINPSHVFDALEVLLAMKEPSCVF
jgi:heptosyltransferase-2